MILHNKNREEYREPIFVKGNLSKYDIGQIAKAIDQFQSLKLSSETKISSLEVRLMTVIKEKGNCIESQSLVWSIKEESDFIKGFVSEIERYKDFFR